jgi:site-specific DNA-methyltransferase (adenine-specific)
VTHRGDLFDVLPTMPEASIDACVTDPPYDLTSGKRGGSGEASVNLNSPAGRSRISTGFMGMKWDGTGVAFKPETWREVSRVMKPGAYLVAFGGTRTYHRMACAIEDAGFEIRDALAWLYGSGFPKNHDLGDGKGTALKPAYEPIVLAWKPFRGTIQKCHAIHGTAALNIEACRIGSDDTRRFKPAAGAMSFPHSDDAWEPRDVEVGSENGRWPANVVIDDVAAEAIDAQSGILTSGAYSGVRNTDGGRNVYGAFAGVGRHQENEGHSASVGGASRFYYCAKPSRDERDMGCYGLAAKPRDESRKEGNPGGDNPRNRGLQPRGNYHPTVKPIDLMRWLVRLVTPINGTVLDPFTGSGTTGCACAYEGRQFIGIEREAEYVEIAERRIAACLPLFTERPA